MGGCAGVKQPPNENIELSKHISLKKMHESIIQEGGKTTLQIHNNHLEGNFETQENVVQACGYSFENKEILTSQQQAVNELAFRCKHLKEAYEEHKIDDAHHLAIKIEDQLKELPSNTRFPFPIKEMQELVSNIKEEFQDVHNYDTEMESEGWIFQKKEDNITISSRIQGDSVGVLAETEVDIPFDKLIVIFVAFDLHTHFVPFMERANLERDVSRNCKFAFCRNKVPLLTAREAYIQGVGYNRLDHNGSVFLFTRSIHNRPQIQDKYKYYPVLNTDSVPLAYKYLVVKYQPMRQGLGKIKLAMNIDMKINFIPMFMMESISKQFARDFFCNLLKIGRKFEGSLWEKEQKKNPQFSDFFKNTINEYIDRKKLK